MIIKDDLPLHVNSIHIETKNNFIQLILKNIVNEITLSASIHQIRDSFYIKKECKNYVLFYCPKRISI